MRLLLSLGVGLACFLALGLMWYLNSGPRVVLYCAQDQEFAVGILQRFRDQTGLRVDPKYDTEADKSVSLYLEIVKEARRPRCDVFWNNEILSTIRLQKQKLLLPYASPSAKKLKPFPESAVSGDDAWHAFATRPRILLVNTERLPKEEDWPRSLLDLTHERYKGKVVMSRPQFGTSATQAACLFEVLGNDEAKRYYRGLRSNEIQIAPGNKQVAEWVGQGRTPTGQAVAVGVTDPDDALAEIRAGKKVKLLFPDRAGANKDFPRLGTLFIPNTVAIPINCPNPEGARQLVDYLLSAEVEAELAKSESHQIPFNPDVEPPKELDIKGVKPMAVDFGKAAALWEEVQKFLIEEFAR
jgi:iron(III) transport system substrate-binding protein